MSKRVAVFVDGANFFYMQKDRLGWWVDPKRMLEYIGNKIGIVEEAIYYVGVRPNQEPEQQKYLKALTHMGYTLETKVLRTIQTSEGERNKANLDVEIAIDMFNLIERYDVAVLVSGDADFRRAIQILLSRGKGVKVFSTAGFIAQDLRECTGRHFTDLQEIREEVEKRAS